MQEVARDAGRSGNGDVDAPSRELVGDDPLGLMVSKATSSRSDPRRRSLHGLLVGSEPVAATVRHASHSFGNRRFKTRRSADRGMSGRLYGGPLIEDHEDSGSEPWHVYPRRNVAGSGRHG